MESGGENLRTAGKRDAAGRGGAGLLAGLCRRRHRPEAARPVLMRASSGRIDWLRTRRRRHKRG